MKKHGLAWLLLSATVVSGDWVRAKLSMGHRSNVSRGVRKIQEDEVESGTLRTILQPCKNPFAHGKGAGADRGSVINYGLAVRYCKSLVNSHMEDSELTDALASALDDENVVGKRHEMDEPGEAYAFIFPCRSMSVYAKVNLTTPEEIVIVYSAHRPLRGQQLI